MKGTLFLNPSDEVESERLRRDPHFYENNGLKSKEWVESTVEPLTHEGKVARPRLVVWKIIAYDEAGLRYAIQRIAKPPEDLKAVFEGKEKILYSSAIFVVDDPGFIWADWDLKEKLFAAGVPGEIIYVPAKTRFKSPDIDKMYLPFKSANQSGQEIIVDREVGCWRFYRPVLDWF